MFKNFINFMTKKLPPMTKEDTIYIGRKPTMSYVKEVIRELRSGKEVVNLKARGVLISKVVDVAEITRNRFIPDLKVVGYVMGTEKLIPGSEESSRGVSALAIRLSKEDYEMEIVYL